MPYKFLEDVAIADIAFEATGKTLKELLESAALAVTNTMIKDLDEIEKKVSKEFDVEGENPEKLLYNFLQEIIFYKDAELLLFNRFDVDVVHGKEKLKLKAKVHGEKLDMKKHELLVDVKAVTWHMFKVEETKTGWKAFVILDV